MERYEFTVHGADETIAITHSAALPDLRAAWPVIVDLAHRVDGVGSRIIVTNVAADVLMLVGVATAGSFANTRTQSDGRSIADDRATEAQSSP